MLDTFEKIDLRNDGINKYIEHQLLIELFSKTIH